MRKLVTMLAAAAVLTGATGASAQTAAASVSITIPQLLSINVTNTTVAFAQPAFTDYDAGNIASTTTSVISTRGNLAHDVTVAANAANFSWTGTGTNPNKLASDFQWSKDAGTSWTPLSTTATDVLTALGAGTNTSAASVTYKMLLNETTDIPGTYSLNFTYTVVAN